MPTRVFVEESGDQHVYLVTADDGSKWHEYEWRPGSPPAEIERLRGELRTDVEALVTALDTWSLLTTLDKDTATQRCIAAVGRLAQLANLEAGSD